MMLSSKEPDLQCYEDILYRIGRELSEIEGQNIAILNKLERTIQEEERPFSILLHLQRKQIISEAKPECLMQVLNRIYRQDLAKKSKEMNDNLKKKKKGKKLPVQVRQPATTTDAINEDSAHFLIARSQINQLARSLANLKSLGYSCSETIAKLKETNKSLSRMEIEAGLPSTSYFAKSFPADEDSSSYCSISSQSSLNSNTTSTGHMPTMVVGEEEHYEELTVVVPSQPEPIVQEIDSRPPQPTPKPSSRHPKQSIEKGTDKLVQLPLTPSINRGRVPLPGMAHDTADKTLTDDDYTGDDSGHGTGSGFTNVAPFLKKTIQAPSPPPKPNKKPPKPSPKPSPKLQQHVMYTPLVTRNRSATTDEGYTQLQQTNHPLVEQYIADKK